MNIDILCVGKIKESYLNDAISEYSKRLSKYCNLKIYEVQDEKTDESYKAALIDKVKETEASRILKHIKKNAYIISLEIDAKSISSKELADKIKNVATYDSNDIQFIVGGSYGLHNSVISAADFHLSFSKMTFPHQLMRVILLEQIYRSFKIINNEPYHK